MRKITRSAKTLVKHQSMEYPFDDKELFEKNTMHVQFDEMDVIYCFMEIGNVPIQGDVLKKQEQDL